MNTLIPELILVILGLIAFFLHRSPRSRSSSRLPAYPSARYRHQRTTQDEFVQCVDTLLGRQGHQMGPWKPSRQHTQIAQCVTCGKTFEIEHGHVLGGLDTRDPFLCDEVRCPRPHARARAEWQQALTPRSARQARSRYSA